tara:strand:+ start:1755 stop:1955 length:201 start_codon:yes stop_codon:yes gene_type:complete
LEVPNPLIDIRGVGAIKNFGGGAYEKFPLDKFCNVKNIVHLWGGKGGAFLSRHLKHHDRYKIKQCF